MLNYSNELRKLSEGSGSRSEDQSLILTGKRYVHSYMSTISKMSGYLRRSASQGIMADTQY